MTIRQSGNSVLQCYVVLEPSGYTVKETDGGLIPKHLVTGTVKVPQEWIKKIPFFVRKHATTKTIDRIAKQYPELYALAKRPGELPEKEREELRDIITRIFKEKMDKHNIK